MPLQKNIHLNASISVVASSMIKARTFQSERSFIPAANNVDNHLQISPMVFHDEITQATGTPL